MKRILILDNNDSFTYNLVHYVEELARQKVDVRKTDSIQLHEIKPYQYIIFSPGPGLPEQDGKMVQIIRRYGQKAKILGVCLGHQAIALAFGGKLKNLPTVFHGISSKVLISKPSEALFVGLSEHFMAGRYHSWVIDKDHLPETLTITAEDEQASIMAISHTYLPIKGVQFHPESILTPMGKKMIGNFLEMR